MIGMDTSFPETPPDGDRALLLDQQLCFALYSSSLLLTKLYKPHLDALGLTYPQYLVMLVLWEQDDQVVSQLGERLGLDSGTLTPLLKRLEAHGWVRRERDEADERRVRVKLTEEGSALKANARSVPPAMRCLMGGADVDLGQLRTALQSLRQRLAQHG
jgi:DNA-binding MarR family transcriptional regulator